MKELEEISKLADKTRKEVLILTKASEYIDELKQENAQLKMQIDDLIKKYKDMVKQVGDEIYEKGTFNCNVTFLYAKHTCYLETINDLSKLKEVKK